MPQIINGIEKREMEKVIKDVHEIEVECWDDTMAASYDTIKRRFDFFSDGLWRLYDDIGELQAYMYFFRINKLSANKYETWDDYTSNGTCSNFDEFGEVLFGVSIGSRGSKYGEMLFSHGVNKMLKGHYEGAQVIRACSRIPTLSKLELLGTKVEDLTMNSAAILNDPVVNMLRGLEFIPISLCKEGYSIDSESLGYCLTMEREI